MTPKRRYLYELREVYEIDEYKNEEEIDSNIKNNYIVEDKIEYEKTYNLNAEQLKALINMTPLLKMRNKIDEINLTHITIALNIYILRIKE